jgi:hypothetical protein
MIPVDPIAFLRFMKVCLGDYPEPAKADRRNIAT